jgi:hypothetical protein
VPGVAPSSGEDVPSAPHRDTETSLAHAASLDGSASWEGVAWEAPASATARIPLAARSVGEGKALAITSGERVILGMLALCRAGQERVLLRGNWGSVGAGAHALAMRHARRVS